MKTIVYPAVLLLFLLGNCFALYKMFADKQDFFDKIPKLTENGFVTLRLLPVLNIIAIIGLWFFKSWAPWLAIACGVAVIIADLYFGITYHLFVAIPSTLILMFFIIRFWNHFK